MNWQELAPGCFTGIDWSQAGATDGADPYLVWAEANRFAGYGGMPAQWLPVAIELHRSCTVNQLIAAAAAAWLHVPPVYASGPLATGLRFCTARAGAEFFRQIRPGGCLHRIVRRFELGLPAGNHVRDPHAREPEQLPAGADRSAGGNGAALPLDGKVLALIDDSLALAHASFMDGNGRSRVAFFWRQDGEGVGAVPAGLDYGRELTAADIDRAVLRNTQTERSGCDEAGVYIDLGLSTLGRQSARGPLAFRGLDAAQSHGTLVLDLAAGPRELGASLANLPPDFEAPPGWQQAHDAASRCPIVAVQLDCDTVRDTSGGSMNVSILDALMYALSRCGPQAQIVANVSFGTLAGPHDGTSLLEAAMDQLIALQRGRLQIVIAAGNGYQSRTHANWLLPAADPVSPQAAPATLDWIVQPDGQTESFLELWLAGGADGVVLEITPPGHKPSPPLQFGQSALWADDDGLPCCAVIYPKCVSTGMRGTCALIAVAPTFSFEPGAVTAPSGSWKVKLANRGRAAIVDAYVERDDIVAGSTSGARQSLLADAGYDCTADVDDPGSATPIRRSGSFNSIATGRRTVSVGATRASAVAQGGQPARSEWARYSPRLPDPDAARPARHGVVKTPDNKGYGDENAVVEGLAGAGSRSGSRVRLKGTSTAAPQVARRILNRL